MGAASSDSSRRAITGKAHTLPPVPVAETWRDEVSALRDVPEDLAVCLFRALRNVRMWAETDPEKRKSLFRFPSPGTLESLGYACMRAPQLIEAFGTFSSLLRDPGRVSAARIAEACTQVYEWAEARSLLQTGMHFAEAAAVVDPSHPTYAINAGWVCRRSVSYDRAATWYQRGYMLAVQLRRHDLTLSREESIRALVEYGALLKDQGRDAEAKEYYCRAAKRAERTGRRRQAAVVHHYLLGLAAEVGSFEESHEYAQQAFDLYPRHDRQIPALAHDWAFLLVRFRHYTPAVALLELAVSRTYSPELQTLYWGTLARAMAGARRREGFDSAVKQTLSFIGLYEEYAPAALVNLSEGARTFEEWDRAEQFVGMAVEFARQRQDAVVERNALELLDRIAVREPAPLEEEPSNPGQVRILARRLAARLRNWKVQSPAEDAPP
jgi:tetratricopeptide (TPR) repeat protein